MDNYIDEFKALTAPEKEPIFRYITSIRWLCEVCKDHQQRKFGRGLFKRKYEPWEQPVFGHVTHDAVSLNAITLPKELRNVVEGYTKKHLSYKCGEALREITEVFDNLKNNLRS